MVVTATLWNKGEASFVADGELRIRSTQGDRRAYPPVKMEANAKTIFPGGRRDYTAVVAYVLPPGRYEAGVAFEYGEKWRKVSGKATFELNHEVGPVRGTGDGPFATSFKVTPAKVDVCLPPGAERNSFVSASNLIGEPVVIHARVEAEIPTETGWVRVPQSVEVRQGATANIRLVICAPTDLAGLHKFSLTLETSLGDKVTVPVCVSPESRSERKGPQ
jgi:hypothetical protein